MFAIAIQGANAGEIYKWTDANGQVHFGDRSSAPSSGKKIDVKVQPANESSSEQRELSRPAQPGISSPPSPPSTRASMGESKPVDPSKVGPGCQDLIEQISKVKPGTNWESLYARFNASCHGIAYECDTYRTHPEKNKCTWVERTGSNVLRTNNYE